MATIVIHAGRPKTGSTSIQRWVVDNHARLRERHGVEILVARQPKGEGTADGVRLERYESGDVTSNWVVWSWFAAKRPAVIPRRFIDDLARLADEFPTLLVTAEGLSNAFALDEAFVVGFEELARAHDVRVAIYVRPQHSAMEAEWRQAGFKHRELEPSDWVRTQTRRLNYLRVLDAFGDLAPNVALGMRPFVPDLLDGASPVEDFVRRFLSLDEELTDQHANPGLPLELVNELRHAPEGWFWGWNGIIDEERYSRESFAALLEGLELPESQKIRRSRQILQQYCHDVFESENQELIRRLEWPLSDFVPPVGDVLGEDWSLNELDVLWSPDASEAEQALLYDVLRAALSRERIDGRTIHDMVESSGSHSSRIARARRVLAREGMIRGSANLLRRIVRRLREAMHRS